MKKRLEYLVLALVLCALASCQTAASTIVPASLPPTVRPSAIPSAAGPPTLPAATRSSDSDAFALEVVGSDGSKVLSLEEVKGLPPVQGWAGIKNTLGKITAPALHKGVLLEDICQTVGGIAPQQSLDLIAKDGFVTTMTYEQAIQGQVVTYDPVSGSEVKIAEPLQVILAYERGGQPLEERSDGSLRMAIISPRSNQVTDGHWAVKWVRRIVIKPASD